MTSKLITIKQAAEILGYSIKTLRIWDKKGYLKSARGENGYRLYKISHLERFAKKISLNRSKRRLVD